MSGDALCVGICMMDWEQGICLGCGRSQQEIDGSEPEEAQPALKADRETDCETAASRDRQAEKDTGQG